MGPPPQQGRREKVCHSGAWDTFSEGTLSPLFQRVLGGAGAGAGALSLVLEYCLL